MDVEKAQAPEYINILTKVGEDVAIARRLICEEACAEGQGQDGYRETDRTMYLEGMKKLDEVHGKITEALEHLLPCGH